MHRHDLAQAHNLQVAAYYSDMGPLAIYHCKFSSPSVTKRTFYDTSQVTYPLSIYILQRIWSMHAW